MSKFNEKINSLIEENLPSYDAVIGVNYLLEKYNTIVKNQQIKELESKFFNYHSNLIHKCSRSVKLVKKIKNIIPEGVNFRSNVYDSTLLQYALTYTRCDCLIRELLKDENIIISKEVINDNISNQQAYLELLIDHKNCPTFNIFELSKKLCEACLNPNRKTIDSLLRKGAHPFLSARPPRVLLKLKPAWHFANTKTRKQIAQYVSNHPELCNFSGNYTYEMDDSACVLITPLIAQNIVN